MSIFCYSLCESSTKVSLSFLFLSFIKIWRKCLFYSAIDVEHTFSLKTLLNKYNNKKERLHLVDDSHKE